MAIHARRRLGLRRINTVIVAAIGQVVAPENGRWHFGIGDPDAIAWVTVAMYAVAAVLCTRAFLTALRAERTIAVSDPIESANQRTLRWLWLFIAAVVVVLGINKQLDLQSLLTQMLRDRATANGWYDDRRKYKFALVAIIAALGSVGTSVLVHGLRDVIGRVRDAVAGLALLVLFVFLRVVSFHYIDVVLFSGTVHASWVLELGGVCVICAAARRADRTTRRRLRDEWAHEDPPPESDSDLATSLHPHPS